MQRDEWRHTGDKKSGGGTNKQAEIQAGRMGETDRQTDRQTDRLTDTRRDPQIKDNYSRKLRFYGYLFP